MKRGIPFTSKTGSASATKAAKSTWALHNLRKSLGVRTPEECQCIMCRLVLASKNKNTVDKE